MPFKYRSSLNSGLGWGVGDGELKSEQLLNPSLQPGVHFSTSYGYLILISQS